ncbi:unnamed protein product [Leuciscus chuanchicus]
MDSLKPVKQHILWEKKAEMFQSRVNELEEENDFLKRQLEEKSAQEQGKKSENPLNPDYVPSLFGYLSPEQRQRRNCYKKYEQTQAVKRKRCTSDVSVSPHDNLTDIEIDNSDSFPDSGQSGEHSYSKEPIHTESSVACLMKPVQKLTDECTRLRAEVHQLKQVIFPAGGVQRQ